MIVKMKKTTILLGEKYRDSALKELRKLGVLHIQDVTPPVSADITHLETKIENVSKALLVLIPEPENLLHVKNDKAESFIDNVLSLNQQKEALLRELEEQIEIHKWFKRWGAISYASVQALKEKNIFIRYYVADKNAFKTVPDEAIIHEANEEQNTVYFAFFSESAEDRLDFKEDPMPPVELSEIENKIDELEKEVEKINEEIKRLSRYRESFIDYQLGLEKQLELVRVKHGMGVDDQISYLQGYCPVEKINEIQKTADKKGWGYIFEEPENPNEVPTLLRNPKWVRMINPLFEFMGTLPGYKELDVSLVFMAFFSIFYALIVGDAGYGLIFLLSTLVFDLKKKDGPREFFNLMYLVSFSTIVWGAVTGTWFGAEQFAQLPFLKIFIIEPISSFNPDSSELIMKLTFIIGVIHLSIGHLMTAFNKMNSLTALAEIGWVLVLWAVFFVANNIVLGSEMASITMPLLLAGVVLILLFANFQKNVIKGMLQTLGNLPLDIISAFSDIVSYIRLFAVGLATVIVATNFNTMAIGSGINSILSGIIAALILFLGHSINLALCGMSILVHGVRLNMLEFSGHVGVQWTGKPYEPFKE
ncbi:hypothetical protein B6I21_06480 [candidate division KSB1 bacterium 4572_119]|nr:MAG: hypothetical protein B6I21_06480 [candidate division KSB1 bacterium 4572_119]